MKKTIAILVLAAAGITTVNAGVHFGINFGIPFPAPVVVVAPTPVVVAPPVCEPTSMPAPIVETVPVCPTPGYVWVGGSWGWSDNHWAWTRGHWGAPSHFEHARYSDHGYRVEHHDGFRGGYHRDAHR
jgi:hypothetical protein